MTRRLYVSAIWLFALTLTLSGCALELPGSQASTSPSKHGSAAGPAGTIKEFQFNVLGGVSNIVFDHAGDLWIDAPTTLGRMFPSGELTKIDTNSLTRSVFQYVPGPDGNLWFIGVPERFGANLPTSATIGRVTPQGQIAEWVIPHTGIVHGTPDISPFGQPVAGSDGNMWYAHSIQGSQCNVGKVDSAGHMKEFTVLRGNCGVSNLMVGSDRNIWFSVWQPTGGAIGRITPAGSVQLFHLPLASSFPDEMWHDPKGNLWFDVTKMANGKPVSTDALATIDQSGRITTIPIHGLDASATEFTMGFDGNVWCIDTSRNTVDQITPTGAIREFNGPSTSAYLSYLAATKDGNIWFAEGGDKFGRITPGGQITEFTITSPGATITAMVVGPDGNLWFGENFAAPGNSYLNTYGDIGRVTV